MSDVEVSSSVEVIGEQAQPGSSSEADGEDTSSPVCHEQVEFLDVRQVYEPSKDIVLKFTVRDGLDVSSHDWIGVYHVGWHDSKKQYFTFVWVPVSAGENNERTVTFTPRYLPTDEKYYQFCYVTKSGEVRGVSSQFQITNQFEDDDLVCVDIEDDALDLVLVQNKARSARDMEAECRIADLHKEVAALEAAKLELEGKSERVAMRKDQLSDQLAGAQAHVASMEAQIVQLRLELATAKTEKATVMEQKQESAVMVTQIESRLSALALDLDGASAARDATEEQNRVLGEKLAAAERANTLLRDKVNEIQKELELTNAMLAERTRDYEREYEECVQLQATIDNGTGRMERLEQEVEHMRQDADRMTEALDSANQRKRADDDLLFEKDKQISVLQERLVGGDEARMSEMNQVVVENADLADECERRGKTVDDLQSELMALRMSIDQREVECNSTMDNAETMRAITEQNMAELAGENRALHEENREMKAEAEVMRREIATLREAQQASGSSPAIYALRKAVGEMQQKCEEAHAANRQQVRVSRAAEAAVKVLEAELGSQSELNDTLRQKLNEAAEHYRAKYIECAELKRRLDQQEFAMQEGAVVGANDVEKMQVTLTALSAERDDLVVDIEELKDEVSRVRTEKEHLEQEKQRLEQENIGYFLNVRQGAESSIRPLSALAAEAAPTAAAGEISDSESVPGVGPGSLLLQRDPRYCPVCNCDLPWTMSIEEVQVHCSQHFDI